MVNIIIKQNKLEVLSQIVVKNFKVSKRSVAFFLKEYSSTPTEGTM